MYNRLFNLTITRVALFVVALMAISLVALPVYNLAFAQETDTIEYPENGTGAVATFTATDPENRMIHWSLLGAGTSDGITADDYADVSQFSISANGVLSFDFRPDYENPRGLALDTRNTNTYRVVVAAADEPEGAADRVEGYRKVTVTVTDMDEGGVITLDAQQPQESRDLTATLMDDDASDAQIAAAKWKWEHSESQDGPWTVILTATGEEYTLLGVVDKYLRATATYTDGHGSDKNAQVVSAHMVRAMPAANNAAPVFPDEDTGTTGTIEVGREVDENSPPGTRVGNPVVANDAPGDTLTYTLADVEDNYRIDPATGQITVGPRTMLDADTDASDSVMVTATDPESGATSQTVTITINDVNEDPVITDGDTRVSVREDTDTTTQVGTSTYTADHEALGTACGNTTECTWSLEGPDAGDFKIGNQTGNTTFGQLTFKEDPNYEMPADSNEDNEYMVTVVVTDAGIDGQGKLTAERAVVMTVTNVDEEGTVTLSSEQPKIGIELTATLEDLDGVVADSVKWTWHAVAAVNATDANAIEMATSATYTPEMTGDLSAKASYTDGHGANKEAAGAANAVVANSANVAPEFPATETGMREVPEGTAAAVAIGVPVVAPDANDQPTTLTYTLSGTDMASFDIVRTTGQLQTKAKLDYETKNSYMVTVTAMDPDRASDSIDVTIKVTDEDEAPEIAGDDIAEDFRENGPNLEIERFRATDPEGRMVYWSLLGTGANGTPTDINPGTDSADVGQFSISANGVLSFRFSPDYEAPRGDNSSTNNTYRVVVVAADEPTGAGDGIMSGYKKVTVMVTNVDETETVTLSAERAQIGVELTATYNDLDNESPTLMWKWHLGGSEISGANNNTYNPIRSGTLRAEASYTKTDGSIKRVSKTISVRGVPAVANAVPIFPTGSGARSVDENSPPGTRVGAPVAANDAPGDTLTYTLAGDTANLFDIDQATGQITVGARTQLEVDTEDMYEVMVTATDPWGAATGAAPQDVTITINDVNEAPMITAGATRVSFLEETETTTLVGVAYTAMDVDQTDDVDWSVSGTDAGDFAISAAGALTFKEIPNYEMPADSNGDNVYMVTVVATDDGVDSNNKMTAERAVVVTVTNEDEDGTVTLSAVQPKIGIALTATLDDPDGVVADSVKWTWHSMASVVDSTAEENVIEMATSATYTPEVVGPLTVRASYTDGHGAGKSATVAGQINEVVPNLANVAPEFLATETGMREVAEGTDAGVAINDGDADPADDPVEATDANIVDGTGDTLTYTLSGTDMASFDIVRSSGQLQTKAKLDYETKNSYMVTVTATDPDGAQCVH